MEEVKRTSPAGTSFKWGIITGLIVVVVSYIASMNIDWTNFEEIEASRNSWSQWVGYLLLALGVVWAQLEHKKKDLGGYMTYGRAVGVATLVGLAAGVCTAIYMFVFFGIIHPEFQQLIIDSAMSKMQDMPSGQEEQMMKWMKITTGPTAMAFYTLFGNVFLSLVIGLISGIFIHKSEE